MAMVYFDLFPFSQGYQNSNTTTTIDYYLLLTQNRAIWQVPNSYGTNTGKNIDSSMAWTL